MYYNNKKLAMSVFWVVLGIVLIALSVTEVLSDSVYAGMGGALTAVGAMQVLRNLKYRKNSEYREKIDTEFNDERNRYLRMKSWAWAGYVTILVECVGVVVSVIAGARTIQLILSYSVCLMLVTYWVAYLIMSKKS